MEQVKAAPELNLRAVAAEIVAAYVGNHVVSATEVPALLRSIYDVLAGLGREPAAPAARDPAVPIERSVQPDHIVCLECGREFKALKRHLRVGHGLTPKDYRARWSLAAHYPMAAPDYAAKRAELARKIGLGRPRKGAARRRGKAA